MTEKLPSWAARALILLAMIAGTVWLVTLRYWGPVVMGAGSALCMLIALPPWKR